MDLPEELLYSTDHHWVRREAEGLLRVGLSDFAQDALGRVVFVELPSEGEGVSVSEPMGEVESTKSVSDLYAPVTAVVVEVNRELLERPQLLNDDPYGSGWLCVLQPSQSQELEALLDAEGYKRLVLASSDSA